MVRPYSDQPELSDSRFWVIARKGPTSRPLPFAWSNFRGVAILLARCVERCGLACVRVIDRWATGAERVAWPPSSEPEDREAC